MENLNYPFIMQVNVVTFGEYFSNKRDFATEYFFDFFRIFFTKWLKFATKKNCHCAFCQTQHPVHKCCIKLFCLATPHVFFIQNLL